MQKITTFVGLIGPMLPGVYRVTEQIIWGKLPHKYRGRMEPSSLGPIDILGSKSIVNIMKVSLAETILALLNNT